MVGTVDADHYSPGSYGLTAGFRCRIRMHLVSAHGVRLLAILA
ncbi:hypothetical protein [Arthrobacter sp. SO5]|nr:hypothetical protein [Arthrobacter sp. SO5]